jgi:hypothetical protein
MTSHPEGGYGCRYCHWTGWVWDGIERASAGPDPTPMIDPEPCPHCTPPSVPELDLDSDAARWMADSDQGEALLVEVPIDSC